MDKGGKRQKRVYHGPINGVKAIKYGTEMLTYAKQETNR